MSNVQQQLDRKLVALVIAIQARNNKVTAPARLAELLADEHQRRRDEMLAENRRQ